MKRPQGLDLKRNGLVAVLLDARGAQAGKAVVVDGGLPGQEFFDRQRITFTGFFEAEKATTHGGDDFGLPANHPAPRVGRRQIGDRQGAAIGTDDCEVTFSGVRFKGRRVDRNFAEAILRTVVKEHKH